MILTPIKYSPDGRVGVAVGFFATPNLGPGTPIYENRGYGLIIFFFDEEGNLIYLYFIPFKHFGNEERMMRHGRFVKALCWHMNIPFSSFKKALHKLVAYCTRNSIILSGASAIDFAAGAIGAWASMTNPVGWAAILVVGALVIIDSARWTYWAYKLHYFEGLLNYV